MVDGGAEGRHFSAADLDPYSYDPDTLCDKHGEPPAAAAGGAEGAGAATKAEPPSDPVLARPGRSEWWMCGLPCTHPACTHPMLTAVGWSVDHGVL